MSAVSLDPYLFFTGNCREAMEFYQSVLGGELEIMTNGQMGNTDEAMKDKVMHANLQGGVVGMMGSDGTRDKYEVCRISLSLSGSDLAELSPLFDKLSEGGSDIVALKTESWGDTFGTFTDKFGIDWMMNIGKPSQA